MKRPQILIIGDSISEGYMPIVKLFFEGAADVYRPNENCGSTLVGIDRLATWLGDRRWDVIHFNWGLHDLRCVHQNGEFAEIPNGRHFVSLPDYETNLRLLVGRLLKTGAKLIWATTTPVPAGCLWRREHDEIRFNEAAARVMGDHEILINDLHRSVISRLQALQEPNDIHFNAVGSAFLAHKVSEAILSLNVDCPPSQSQKSGNDQLTKSGRELPTGLSWWWRN